ncbi:MAG TPA: hypothetical protein VGG90_13765 [Candidatus Dormibacteraeota bacterium]
MKGRDLADGFALLVVAVNVMACEAISQGGTGAVQGSPAGTLLPPAAVSCPNYSQPYGDAPALLKMLSATTGWAKDGLRTTDGGLHWRKISDPKLRADAVNSFQRQSEPPLYAEVYMDATHAWQGRSYVATNSCFDHYTVSATSDAGASWIESAPITVDVPSGLTIVQVQMGFVDLQNGWLWFGVGQLQFDAGMQQGGTATAGALFGTADGGAHWTLVSKIAVSSFGATAVQSCQSGFGPVAFASTAVGWIEVSCQKPEPELLATHDGGHSWKVQLLPTGDATCPCGASQLTVLDQTHALVDLYGTKSPSAVTLSTSDGGQTWKVLPKFPNAGYVFVTDHVDANNFWAIVSAPDWNKGQPTRDSLYRSSDGGASWTLVAASLPFGYPVDAIAFGDATHGLVTQPANSTTGGPIGPGTEMLTTSDGGHTWTDITPVIAPAAS